MRPARFRTSKRDSSGTNIFDLSSVRHGKLHRVAASGQERVSKANRGNKRGNRVLMMKLKASIYEGYKASFVRFHRPRIDGG